jgi:hypothetical protein
MHWTWLTHCLSKLVLLCCCTTWLQDFVLDYALDVADPHSPRALMWATLPHPHELRHLLNFPSSYLPLLQHPQLVRRRHRRALTSTDCAISHLACSRQWCVISCMQQHALDGSCSCSSSVFHHATKHNQLDC